MAKKITVDQLIAAMTSKHDRDLMAARAFLSGLSLEQIGVFADSLNSIRDQVPANATSQMRAWVGAVESFAKIGLTNAVIERLEKNKEAFNRDGS